MAVAQEIYSAQQYAPRDALVWHIPAGDRRFYDRHRDGGVFDEGWNVHQTLTQRYSKDVPRIPFDGVAVVEVGIGAALEVLGRKTKSKGIRNIGRFLLGTGGGYFILTRGIDALSRSASEAPILLQTNQEPGISVIPTSTIPEIYVAPFTVTPSLTPEPTFTSTPSSTPTPNIFERYNLFPTPTLLPNETPQSGGGLYARYLVGKEAGEILEGYTQGIGSGRDGAMRYELSPDSLVFPEGWPQYGQIYGAWPIPPTDHRMSVSVYCSNPCVMRLVDAKDQQILHTYPAVPSHSDDSTKKYFAYTELPMVAGTDTWIVLEPGEPGSLEPLWHARVEYGPLEEPEIVLARRPDPFTGEIADAPTIRGVATIPGSEEELATREHQAHVVVGKRVGRAEQWWQDVTTTEDGWKHVSVSVNRDLFAIPYGDSVTTKVIAPVHLTAGYHDVKIRCDDHCDVSFATPYGAQLGKISYDLEKQAKGEERDQFGYLHKTIFLGTDTPWIIIEHDDSYGGAGIDVQVMP